MFFDQGLFEDTQRHQMCIVGLLLLQGVDGLTLRFDLPLDAAIFSLQPSKVLAPQDA